jgi:hypothetical protein
MKTSATPVNKEQSNGSSYDNQMGIEIHKKAATHFEAAAKHHRDAAKQHEAGNHERAAQSTVSAHGHAILASEAQREDVTHHATSN